MKKTDKSVTDAPVTAKLKDGQVVVENKLNGILFSFPAAVWPKVLWQQRQWTERMTPWWDTDALDWSPRAWRLRESVVKAINKLFPVEQSLTSHSRKRGQAKSGSCGAALPGIKL